MNDQRTLSRLGAQEMDDDYKEYHITCRYQYMRNLIPSLNVINTIVSLYIHKYNPILLHQCRTPLGPNMAVPTLTLVLPAAMACS